MGAACLRTINAHGDPETGREERNGQGALAGTEQPPGSLTDWSRALTTDSPCRFVLGERAEDQTMELARGPPAASRRTAGPSLACWPKSPLLPL